jgi:hypothetical protein
MKTPFVTRRRVGIALLIVFILLAAYAWLSATAWRTYAARLQSEKSDYQSLTAKISSSRTSRSDRVAAISTLSKHLQRDETGRCNINGAFSWQSALVPVLKTGVERCKTAGNALRTVQTSIEALNEYLASEGRLEAILARLSSGSIAEADLTNKGLNSVKAVQKNLQAVKATDSNSKQLLSQAKTMITSLVNDWNALISANKAQDTNAYMKAANTLNQDYASLGELADSSDNILLKLVQSLKESETKAF